MTDLPIDVIRSKRRRRTISAEVVDGRLKVRVPYGLSQHRETELVEQATERVLRKLSSRWIDLKERARELAERYGLPKPVSVEWSSRQMQRWGSCTPAEGHIRISNRLVSVPPWVLDSVLVHELVHLEVCRPRSRLPVAGQSLRARREGQGISDRQERRPCHLTVAIRQFPPSLNDQGWGTGYAQRMQH